MPILWLKKEHKYSRETEHYCYLRCQKAAGEWSQDSKERKYYLFWMNAHYLCGELNIQPCMEAECKQQVR